MTEIAVLAALTGSATAVSALLAHEARAVYHDGLRVRVADASMGVGARRALVSEGWQIGAGFIAWFAVPYALLSGVLISHIVFIPADLFGLWFRRRIAVGVAGLMYGAVAATLISVAGLLVANAPVEVSKIPHIFADTAAAFLPLIPIQAAMRLDKLRFGIPSIALGAALWLAGEPVGLGRVVGPTLAACLPLIVAGARSRPSDISLDAFEPAIARVRQSAPGLVVLALLVGALGGALFLAGEPLAALLLFGGHFDGAAIVAILTAVAFMPLVVTTAMASGVYSSQGYPDWLLAPGYLVGQPLIGSVAAAALMILETFGLSRMVRLVMRYPELSSVAAALRASSEDVLILTGFAGSVIAASEAWGNSGLFGLGGLYLANEAADRRVPLMAIGPVALIILMLVGWISRTAVK